MLVVNPPIPANCIDCKATDVIGPRWPPRERQRPALSQDVKRGASSHHTRVAISSRVLSVFLVR